MNITLGTREGIEAAKIIFGELINVESKVSDKGTRKYNIGDTLELHGLVDYPEFNGEIVIITNYRESSSELNAYYIKSVSGKVEDFLNFVWEKRLRPVR